MSAEIIMHINYCEQGQSLEYACRKAVEWGYDGVEFRQIPRRGQVDPEMYYDEVAVAVEKSGLKSVIFGGPPTNILSSDTGEREAEIKRQEQFFRLASERFHLTVWNARTPNIKREVNGNRLTGSKAATDDEWRWATEAYTRFGDVAASLGFRLAFETHHHNLTDSVSATRSLVDRIDHPAVGVNLDYGNLIAMEDTDPLDEAVKTAGDRLYYIHLKNALGLSGEYATTRVGLGDGAINNRALLRAAQAVKYDGPICIESPRPGDREWYAQQDLAYLKALLSDLG